MKNRKPKKRSKRLPINLLRKKQRERRHTHKKKRNTRKLKIDTERIVHQELIDATEAELKKILLANEVLSDIPCDYTPEELLGEIAIAKDYATTIYIERDGLSTLTVVLSQKNPTIANLKRAIELTARAQHKRELRERYESRRKRRRLSEETGNMSDSDDGGVNAPNDNKVATNQKRQQQEKRRQQQVETTTAWLMANRSTGEFIHSTTRCGHPHRTTVSWRFLWRAYMLIDVHSKNPLYDEDGRKLLTDCGIENGTTLRFCKREIYMKRRRQK